MISHDYAPNIGGIAAHVTNLATHLARRGHDVTVITMRYDRALPFSKSEGKLRVMRMLVPDVGKLRGFCFVAQAAPLLLALSLWRRFDVIHWHNFFPDAVVAFFGRAAKKVFTNHSSTFLDIFEKGDGRLIRWLTRQAKYIIGPSAELAEKSRRFFGRADYQSVYIPNGVDVDYFRPLDTEQRRRERAELLHRFGFGPETFIVVCPRRLEPKNGVRYFVEAVPRIAASFPNLLCLVLGNDADRAYASEVRALSKAIGADAHVRFLGAVPNPEMVRYYQVADIVVLPSLMEATSIAGLEAIASGVPVVGTDVGGIPDIVRAGHNGIIVPPRDPEAIATAVTSLMRDAERRDKYSHHARELAVSRFSWSSITNQTLKIYAAA